MHATYGHIIYIIGCCLYLEFWNLIRWYCVQYTYKADSPRYMCTWNIIHGLRLVKDNSNLINTWIVQDKHLTVLYRVIHNNNVLTHLVVELKNVQYSFRTIEIQPDFARYERFFYNSTLLSVTYLNGEMCWSIFETMRLSWITLSMICLPTHIRVKSIHFFVFH